MTKIPSDRHRRKSDSLTRTAAKIATILATAIGGSVGVGAWKDREAAIRQEEKLQALAAVVEANRKNAADDRDALRAWLKSIGDRVSMGGRIEMPHNAASHK